MEIFRKIKQHWKWVTGYTVVFVSPNGKYVKQYIVHHRIGRKPIMRMEERREALRGRSLDVIIFDEVSLLSEAEIAELKRPIPDGNVLFKQEYMCDWPKGEDNDTSRSN